MSDASDKAKAWLEYHGHKRCGFLPEDDTASLAALLEAYGDERLEEAAKVADEAKRSADCAGNPYDSTSCDHYEQASRTAEYIADDIRALKKGKP